MEYVMIRLLNVRRSIIYSGASGKIHIVGGFGAVTLASFEDSVLLLNAHLNEKLPCLSHMI